MRRATSRTALGIVILGLVATACVSPNDPGVAIDSRDADLVFGVKDPDNTPPTPQQAPTQAAFDDSFEFAEFGFDVPDSSFDVPELREDPGPCPNPDPLATPATVTEAFVTADPKVGVYKWVASKVETIDGEAVESSLPIHKHIVRELQKIDNTRFSYETVQPLFDGDGNFLVSEWTVEKDAETVTPPNESGPVLGAVKDVTAPPRVGEPEGGLMLTGLRVVDANDEPVPGVQSFSPTTGLMLLPLPVTSGQSFQSSAVDPRTGQTVVVEGTTRTRARVNACGEVTDGWRVVGKQTISAAGDTTEIEFDMIVATQFGALIIEETTRDKSTNTFFTTRIGQLDPAPLPEGQR